MMAWLPLNLPDASCYQKHSLARLEKEKDAHTNELIQTVKAAETKVTGAEERAREGKVLEVMVETDDFERREKAYLSSSQPLEGSPICNAKQISILHKCRGHWTRWRM